MKYGSISWNSRDKICGITQTNFSSEEVYGYPFSRESHGH
jgi:hypothetical protein